MTLDDDGALAEDRGLLQSGFLAVHPKDENGRTVLSVDRIKAVLPFASRDAAVSEVGRRLLENKLLVIVCSL
jgi:hypothetical protein